ncbi:hypothetical protein ACFE04_003401 [Oxalis oulophora]
MTRKRSTPKGVVEDVLCSDSSVKKWGFKIHIGGKVIHEPTLEYVGGESYDNDVSPKGFNLEVLEESDSDVGRNDNVVVAVHEDEAVVHEEEVAVHDMSMAGHNVDVNEIMAVAVAMADVTVVMANMEVTVADVMTIVELAMTDVAVTDMGENDVAVIDNGSDVDDVSVDGISFCSDIEDEELVSLITQANNLTETAATHGPEKDAIRQNRRVTNASNSDDEYEVGPDYMDDSNLNWSLTEDEDDVANINGEGEVNSAQVGVDEEEIPHTGEHLRVDSVSRNNKRLEKAEKWMSQITPRILDIYDHYSEASRSCMVLFGVRNGWEGDEEALAASVAAYYASIGKVPVQASTGPSAPPIAEGVPEAGPSVPSSAVPEKPKRKKVKLTIGLSKPVSTVPVVAVPTVPVKAPTVPVQATTVPVQATTITVPDVPVVAPFMRGPKLVKKRKAGDVLGQISKKPWK